MRELRFIQVQKDNPQHNEIFKDMMLPYSEELDSDTPDNEPTSEEDIIKWTQSIINMQGPHDRHLELVFIGDNPIGFLYGKVDHEHHKGHKKVGYGYVMEYYLKLEYRRKGYGRTMFRRLEQHFSGHGVKRMYLNTTKASEPFWNAMGFAPTDEIQPHNNMLIWEKELLSHGNVKKERLHYAAVPFPLFLGIANILFVFVFYDMECKQSALCFVFRVINFVVVICKPCCYCIKFVLFNFLFQIIKLRRIKKFSQRNPESIA